MDWQDIILNEIKEVSSEVKDIRKEGQEHAKEVDGRLSAIESDLKYHIKRTNLLEDSIQPIQKHVNGVRYIGWAVTGLVGIVIAAGSLALALSRLGLI